jgi:PAS domain S-box-containing protein
MRQASHRSPATLTAIAVAYVAAGKLGLTLAFLNENATAVWPPTGIALAACLLLGVGVWPAVAAGALVVNLTNSGSPLASVAIAGGNTLEAVAGAWLIARYAGGARPFTSARDTWRFSLLSGVAALISAGFGTGALAAGGLLRGEHPAMVFATWWIGDAVGAIVVAPPILLWASERQAAGRSAAEWLLLWVSVAAVAAFVFGRSPAGLRGYPLEFLTVGVLLWGAFRFGALTTSLATALTGAIAVWGTVRGYGPFARPAPNESLVLLQSFMGVASILILVVAAEVAARRRTAALLSAANENLERRVAARTEELLRVHDRLAEAQGVAHVGSWEWDVRTNALWWSDELYRIYGVPHDVPATYDTFVQHVHPDDRARIGAVIQQSLATGEPFEFEHRIVRGRDGAVRTLFARGRVTPGADGAPARMSGVGHDITEAKQAEEERAQLLHEQVARREAEESNRAKDQFLATLSHELRTPMNAVLGWSQMLRLLPLSEREQARAVDAIFRNVQIQAQLVSDILDVSRIATGTFSVERHRVRLDTVIDEAIETVREAAAVRGVTISFCRPSSVMEVDGDATRLRQVVWNLLVNAVKFVGGGGRVRVTVARQAEAFELVVEDDGPGIAPEFLPHVFDRFRQADGSVTREHGGLGLGLAIVRHIVELHGGTVSASNGEPRGARFTVRLPAAGAAAEPEVT